MTALRNINCEEATDRAAFFVLGALDTREALEVREHLETCSRAHEEFAEIGGVVPHLAELPDELEPPPELRQRLLDSVDADVRARRREYDAAERLVASFGAPRPAPRPEPEITEGQPVPVGPGKPDVAAADRAAGPIESADVVATAPGESRAVAPISGDSSSVAAPTDSPAGHIDGDERSRARAAIAASDQVVAAPASPASRARSAAPVVGMPPAAPIGVPPAAAAVRARERDTLRETRRGRSATPWLIAATSMLAVGALGAWTVMLMSQVSESREHLQAMEAALVAQMQPNAIVAVLEGTPAAPAASGTAVMAPGRPGYLIVRGLPPAEAGKTYQAWYMAGTESRSAGLLKVGSDGIAVLAGLDPSQPVDAMAVTLERDGGVERSSQPPLVYGKVSPKTPS